VLEVVHEQGDEAVALVRVGRLNDGSLVEFAESLQAGVPRERKWVLIVSTLKGCPVGCPICDAGGAYRGKLTATEILEQIDVMVRPRFPGGCIPVGKLKIQFARMGDPVLNDAVLDVLEELPRRYDAPGLMPCISTIAPAGRDAFFQRLSGIKRALYRGGRFQMQFSVHTTSPEARRTLVPARTWSFEQMADYGRLFYEPGDRKVALNFAAAKGFPMEPAELRRWFSPECFAVKLTPVNPTGASVRSGLVSLIDPLRPETCADLRERFAAAGYETIVSIGDLSENRIGSNCGMLARAAGARG